MHIVAKLVLGTALIAGATTSALAQQGPRPGDPPMATYNDPPGPKPDPANIPIHLKDEVFPKNKVFGNSTQPGMYGAITIWQPGNFSRPHFHNTDRFVYVVSGTWWVGAGTDFDTKTTYPIPRAPMLLTSPTGCIGMATASAARRPCFTSWAKARCKPSMWIMMARRWRSNRSRSRVLSEPTLAR